jgi:hypothetical protein
VPADLQSAPFVHLGNRPKSSACYALEIGVVSAKQIPIANVQPEPMMGIEPITYHLQGDCSTIELHRQNIDFLKYKSPYD